MWRQCKSFYAVVSRGKWIVGKEGENENGENSIQIYLKCQKKKKSKSMGILLKSLTEPNSYISKSLKGSIQGKLMETSWSIDLITSLRDQNLAWIKMITSQWFTLPRSMRLTGILNKDYKSLCNKFQMPVLDNFKYNFPLNLLIINYCLPFILFCI